MRRSSSAYSIIIKSRPSFLAGVARTISDDNSNKWQRGEGSSRETEG